jgi:uncharacterized protein
MKKLLSVVSSLMVIGTGSFCFADTYQEGKTAFEHKNYSEAVVAFTKACGSGNSKGCFTLGTMYEKGEGVGENKYKAAALYTQACRGGEALGCANMALTCDTP